MVVGRRTRGSREKFRGFEKKSHARTKSYSGEIPRSGTSYSVINVPHEETVVAWDRSGFRCANFGWATRGTPETRVGHLKHAWDT